MSRQVLLRWQAQAIANLNGVAVSLDGRIARIDPVQAGAPGQCPAEGAHHVANDLEGVDGMNDLTDPPLAGTLRGRQLAAMLVSTKLVQLDLPEACRWDIEGHRVTIQLSALLDSAEEIDALGRWAEFLEAAPHAEGDVYGAGRGLRRVAIDATYRHLPVRVFTGVPVDAIPAEWLTEREAS